MGSGVDIVPHPSKPSSSHIFTHTHTELPMKNSPSKAPK